MVIVLFVLLAVNAGVRAGQSSAPPIRATPGMAGGVLQAGANTSKLAHAYASGPIDSGGTVYQVVLTDRPIPPDAMDKEVSRGGQALLRAG